MDKSGKIFYGGLIAICIAIWIYHVLFVPPTHSEAGQEFIYKIEIIYIDGWKEVITLSEPEFNEPYLDKGCIKTGVFETKRCGVRSFKVIGMTKF